MNLDLVLLVVYAVSVGLALLWFGARYGWRSDVPYWGMAIWPITIPITLWVEAHN